MNSDILLLLWQRMCDRREELYRQADDRHLLDYMCEVFREVEYAFEKGERPKR